MKYIQSFHEYPVTFKSINKGVPSKDADGDMRNIVEITDEELEKLNTSEPYFRTLVNKKRYRILERLPESYKPAALLVNEAKAEAEKAKKELEALKAEMGKSEKKEISYKELQKQAKEKGLENVNISKDKLIEWLNAN